MNNAVGMALVTAIGLAVAALMMLTGRWFSKRSEAQAAARLEDAKAAIEKMTNLPGEEDRVRVENERGYQETPEQQSIARSGIAATARIVAAEQTFRRTPGGQMVDLTVEVQGPEGPYQVTMRIAVAMLDMALCQRGTAIKARIDPNDRNNVIVLFNERLEPASP